jgi:hypothetical protein
MTHQAVIELFNAVRAIAEQNQRLSGEHFSVDGTLIQAWAGHKSFRVQKLLAADQVMFQSSPWKLTGRGKAPSPVLACAGDASLHQLLLAHAQLLGQCVQVQPFG